MQMPKFPGMSFQPFLELQSIMNTATEELIRESMGFWSENFGSNVQYWQTISNKTNNPEALMKANISYMSKQTARILELARKASEIWESTLREYAECMQQKMDSTASETEMHRRKAS